MKIMTIKKYASRTALLALLGAAMTGCMQDDASTTKETTLRLTVATRAGETIANEEMEANEQMRTLRVIVANAGTNNIIYNVYKEDIDPGVSQYTINFGELTIEDSEKFDFYAIANEGSLELGDLESNNIDLTRLKACIINKDYNIKSDGNYPQIPQTAFKTIPVGANENNSAEIQLEFVVAKVNVRFINETGVVQTIGDLGMGSVAPNQGYLFNDDNEAFIDIPIGTTYDNLTLSSSLTVPAETDNNTAEVCAYLYPGKADDYVLSAQWYGDRTVNCSEQGVIDLDRGQQLNIVVTLTAEYEYNVNVMVNAWTEKSMVVPPFE